MIYFFVIIYIIFVVFDNLGNEDDFVLKEF